MAESYTWEFGDGETSTEENPGEVTYSSPGIYEVNYEAIIDTSGYDLTTIQIVDAGCDDISENCIDKLSNAGSSVRYLTVSICADNVLKKIGRSQLYITYLMVGCKRCCKATDNGIDGLLEHGHKHYQFLEIEGELAETVFLEINKPNKVHHF